MLAASSSPSDWQRANRADGVGERSSPTQSAQSTAPGSLDEAQHRRLPTCIVQTVCGTDVPGLQRPGAIKCRPLRSHTILLEPRKPIRFESRHRPTSPVSHPRRPSLRQPPNLRPSRPWKARVASCAPPRPRSRLPDPSIRYYKAALPDWPFPKALTAPAPIVLFFFQLDLSRPLSSTRQLDTAELRQRDTDKLLAKKPRSSTRCPGVLHLQGRVLSASSTRRRPHLRPVSHSRPRSHRPRSPFRPKSHRRHHLPTWSFVPPRISEDLTTPTSPTYQRPFIFGPRWLQLDEA